MDLNDNLANLALFDRYGVLLTDKQYKCLEDYLINNLTLSEISEIYGISRQAVNFNIKESLKSLNFYEEKLGLCEKYGIVESKLSDIGLDGVTINAIMGVLKE